MARRIEKSYTHSYPPCQAKNMILSDFFVFIHFNITSLHQVPSLPVLLAPDVPPQELVSVFLMEWAGKIPIPELF